MKKIFIISFFILVSALIGYRVFSTYIYSGGKNRLNMKDNGLEAIHSLLDTDPEDMGFIIFSAKAEHIFVQYAREGSGLLLDWPIVSTRKERNQKIANKAIEVLDKYDYIFYDENQKIIYTRINDKTGSFMTNVGNNTENIYNLSIELFNYVFNFNDLDKINIELVLNNR